MVGEIIPVCGLMMLEILLLDVAQFTNGEDAFTLHYEPSQRIYNLFCYYE